nr:ribonuclease H-like domain-containing protein [Tanacetum cinerariifolium]
MWCLFPLTALTVLMNGPQPDHEVLEHVDEFDLEEIDLKWQVAMISTRLKKFYKNTGRKLHFDAKEPVGFDMRKFECFNCHNTWHFARECRLKGNQESRRRDAGNTGYKTGHAKDDTEDYALMAFNSSNSGSDTETFDNWQEWTLIFESFDILAFLADCCRKMPVDSAFGVDFKSCVRYCLVLTDF